MRRRWGRRSRCGCTPSRPRRTLGSRGLGRYARLLLRCAVEDGRCIGERPAIEDARDNYSWRPHWITHHGVKVVIDPRVPSTDTRSPNNGIELIEKILLSSKMIRVRLFTIDRIPQAIRISTRVARRNRINSAGKSMRREITIVAHTSQQAAGNLESTVFRRGADVQVLFVDAL